MRILLSRRPSAKGSLSNSEKREERKERREEDARVRGDRLLGTPLPGLLQMGIPFVQKLRMRI